MRKELVVGLRSADLAPRVEGLKQIERRVQELWHASKIYEADPDPSRKKKLVTFPYPYMNGSLHVGHALSATRVDAYARFMRLKGYNVLFPWAWHWTGEPIMGTAKRVVQGDKRIIETLTKMDGVPEDDVKKFSDPYYVARYFTEEGRKAVRDIGFSVDWRREFTTASNPGYACFVTWQYLTLKERGYITQGTHPVVWCPNDKSPTGDHDRAEGEGVSPEELSLIKFPLKQEGKEPVFLVAATFRPETIFGATNIWILPSDGYATVRVDGELWIVSEYCAVVLAEQKHVVENVAKLNGKELLGKVVLNPLTHSELPILPANFIDLKFGTGVVYSVPAHAPYDYAALRDLQLLDDEALSKMGLDPKTVRGISPISIISVEGYSDTPAAEVCESLGIRSQNDSKLEQATQRIYQAEYAKGVMKKNCGEYGALRVSEAKKLVFEGLKKAGYAAVYYDLPSPVVCRCGTRCVVKILENQWFLRYGDSDWKTKAKQCLENMEVYPPEARQWFLDVIDWLQNKPCARRSGLGTPLPWDKEWIVETLSDSTIYMAYYTISKYVNANIVGAENLKPEFFDYVFYGSGNTHAVSKITGVPVTTLESIRGEFLYWYPVDLRNSAKELIPNHLTFFILHHVALFPPEHWPRAVSTNGMLTLEGQPMHKSKGHFVSLRRALEDYGADATRLTLLNGTENLNDPDWNRAAAETSVDKLCSLLQLVEHVSTQRSSKSGEPRNIDRWLLTKLKLRAKLVEEHMEEMRTRSALNEALFEIWEDYRRYLKRSINPNADAVQQFFKQWMIILHPFIPHLAQWCYVLLGGSGLIENAKYPETSLTEEERLLLAREEYIDRIEEDVSNLQKIMSDAKQAEIVIVNQTKRELAKRLIPQLKLERRLTPKLIEAASTGLGDKAKAAGFIQRLIKVTSEWQNYEPSLLVPLLDEEPSILKEAATYISHVYGIEVKVVTEEDASDKNRAASTTPLKPTITFLSSQ